MKRINEKKNTHDSNIWLNVQSILRIGKKSKMNTRLRELNVICSCSLLWRKIFYQTRQLLPSSENEVCLIFSNQEQKLELIFFLHKNNDMVAGRRTSWKSKRRPDITYISFAPVFLISGHACVKLVLKNLVFFPSFYSSAHIQYQRLASS